MLVERDLVHRQLSLVPISIPQACTNAMRSMTNSMGGFTAFLFVCLSDQTMPGSLVPAVTTMIIHDSQRSIITQIDAHGPFHRHSHALRQAPEHRGDRGGSGHAQHND